MNIMNNNVDLSYQKVFELTKHSLNGKTVIKPQDITHIEDRISNAISRVGDGTFHSGRGSWEASP